MAYIKTIDPKFVRDTNSMALINTDVNLKTEYYQKSKFYSEQKNKYSSLENDVLSIKDELSTIRELLKKLVVKET